MIYRGLCLYVLYIHIVTIYISGLAYGRMSGISRNTLKTDIVNFLDGCDLTLEDVKFEYNRSYSSQAVLFSYPAFVYLIF